MNEIKGGTKTMKTLTARKLVAIFTAISLAFLQAAPAGIAGTMRDLKLDAGGAMSDSGGPSMAATGDTGTTGTSGAKAEGAGTTTDFLMGTGAKGADSDSAPALEGADETATTDESAFSENLIDEQIQARIAQLREEAARLEAEAAERTQQVSDLDTQAAEARRIAEQVIANAREQERIAQARMNEGQMLLAAAQKEMAAMPRWKIAIERKIANAQAIIAGAQESQRLASEEIARGRKQLQAANDLFKQSETLLGQAQLLRTQAAAKTAQANAWEPRLTPPEVREYMNYLKTLFKEPRYTVNVRPMNIVCVKAPCPQRYEFTVLGVEKNPGELSKLVIQMQAGVKEMPQVISAEFDSTANVETQLLMEGLRQLSDKPVELLARIRVTAVDEAGIHFDLLQRPVSPYRIYRKTDGTVKLAHDQKLPSLVQHFMDLLQERLDALQSNYSVTAVPQRDGTCLVSVASAIKQALQGHLGNLSFVMKADGTLVRISQATFTDVPDFSGQLLFEGLKTFAQKNNLLVDVQALALMTQITVTKIEKDASGKDVIYFMKDGSSYKVSQDANNNPVLEQEIQASPEDVVRAQSILGVAVVRGVTLMRLPLRVGAASVTSFYDEGGSLLGTLTSNDSLGPQNKPAWRDAEGRLVAIERWENDYKIIEYYNPEGAMTGLTVTHPDGRQIKVSFEIPVGGGSGGKIRNNLGVAMNAVTKAVLDLFERNENVTEVVLKKYETSPGICTMDIPTSHCSELISFDLDSEGAIYQYEIQHYWSDRSGTNTYTVNKFSKTPVIPPAVQAYADALQAALGHGYIVGPVFDGESYRIAINFRTREDCAPGGACPEVIFIPKPGQLTHMSFGIAADGQMDILTATVTFNTGVIIAPVVDAQLLYAGMVQLANPPCPAGQVCPLGPVSVHDPLVLMTQIRVTKVKDGAIFFTTPADGKNYKAYWEGTVARVREIVPVPREILLAAQAILGSGVVRGETRPQTPGVEGAPTVYDFYNAEDRLVGSMETNYTVTPSSREEKWTNAQGQLVAVVKTDGSKILYQYGEGYRVATSYDPQGALNQAILKIENGPEVDVTELYQNGQLPLAEVSLRLSAIVSAVRDLANRLGDGANDLNIKLSEFETLEAFTSNVDCRGEVCPSVYLPGIITYYQIKFEIAEVNFEYRGELSRRGIGSTIDGGTGDVLQPSLPEGWENWNGLDPAMVEIFARPEVANLTTAQAKLDAIKKILLPPEVQVFVDELGAALSWYKVSGVLILDSNPPEYRISVTPPDGSVRPGVPAVFQQGQLRSMSFVVGADGAFLRMEESVFEGIQGVDGQLLYEAMGVCTQGQLCAISPVSRLTKMTQIVVTKVEDGAIFFTTPVDGKNYKAYWEGTVAKVEEELPWQPVMQGEGYFVETNGKTYRLDINGQKTEILNRSALNGETLVWTGTRGEVWAFLWHNASGDSIYQSYDTQTQTWADLSYEGWVALVTPYTPVAQGEGYFVETNGYVYRLDINGQKIEIPGRSPLHADQLLETSLSGGSVFLHFRYGTQSAYIADIFQAYDTASGQWRNVSQEDFVRTLLPAAIPSGWVRTPGNPAYYSENFSTPTGQVLFFYHVTDTAFQKYDMGLWRLSVQGPVDVSPTGIAAIYSVTDYQLATSIHIRHLGNLSEELVLEGGLQSVSYEQDGRIAVITQTDGTQKSVDLNTLQIVSSPVEFVRQLLRSGSVQITEAERAALEAVLADPEVNVEHTVTATGEQYVITTPMQYNVRHILSYDYSQPSVMQWTYAREELVLSQLYAPEGAMVFPATLKHYDASGTLIRVIEIGADQNIISVTSYNDGQGNESQIPAKVEVYPQGSDQLHAVLTYDAQGKLIQMEVYNYDAGGVTYPGSPPLYAPEGAMVFPATLKHYDASGTLIRVIEIGADQNIISVTSYNDGQGNESQIPAKVEVYPQGSDQLHAVLEYNAEGQLIQLTVYNVAGQEVATP